MAVAPVPPTNTVPLPGISHTTQPPEGGADGDRVGGRGDVGGDLGGDPDVRVGTATVPTGGPLPRTGGRATPGPADVAATAGSGVLLGIGLLPGELPPVPPKGQKSPINPPDA